MFVAIVRIRGNPLAVTSEFLSLERRNEFENISKIITDK